MIKLKQSWSDLQGSFWFMPSLITAFSIALALAFIEADSTGNKQWLTRWPRLFGASAAGARGMLSTIAGSMMTVVGVTFSMTLVTLALASSQYTSRILRNFMGDRVTQVVLGIFSGIFTYCLIVLRTIRDANEGGFVPSLAVFFGGPSRRRVLREHVQEIADSAERTIQFPRNRARFEIRLARAREALETEPVLEPSGRSKGSG